MPVLQPTTGTGDCRFRSWFESDSFALSRTLNARGKPSSDTIEAQAVTAVKSGFLQMRQIGGAYPQNWNIRAAIARVRRRRIRLGIFIKKPGEELRHGGSASFSTHVHPRIDPAEQAVGT